MRAFLLAAMIFLSAVIPGVAAVSEEVQQLFDEVKSAFVNAEFDRIDELADRFLLAQERTRSGTFKAQILHEALASAVFVYGEPSHETYNTMDAQVAKWLAANPSSRTAAIFKGKILLNRAWNARGSDAAIAVTPEQWKALRLYARRAGDHLLAVKPHASSNPEWYVAMLNVALALGPREIDAFALSEEALAAHPRYLGIHWQIIRMNLPRWGGTRETIGYWTDRIGTVSDSDANYARAFWILDDDAPEDSIFHRYDADWERMRSGFEEMVELYPTAWNLNGFARFACLAQDKKTTAHLLDRIGTDTDVDAWKFSQVLDYCRQWSSTPDPVGLPEPEEVILVEAYKRDGNGVLRGAFGPVDHVEEDAALQQAQGLVASHESVIAYRLVPNKLTGGYKRPIILFQHGVIPDRQ